jgi:ABC-type arginine transport system ATPase subunit
MQTISTYGLDEVGKHPLSLAKKTLPPVIVFEKGHILEQKHAEVLKQNYISNQKIGDILIYQKH